MDQWLMAADRDSEAKRILRSVADGRFSMAEHTFLRASERGISRGQIVHCAEELIYHRWQEAKKTHLFVGRLEASTVGGFSAVIREGVIIVTVFRRRLTRWEKRLAKF